MLEGVAGIIVAVGGLVAAIGIPLIAWINIRSANKARVAEKLASVQRQEVRLASENAKLASDNAKLASEHAALLAEKAAEAAAAATARLVEIDGKVVETRKALDGRLSELIGEIKMRAHAQGKLEGKLEGKAEEKADEKDRKNGPPPIAAPKGNTTVDVKIVGTEGHVPVVVVKEPKEKG